MDDAISRAKVFKFLNCMEEAVAGEDIISKTALATIKCARRFVIAMPSVDAVPVVRCSECVHRYIDGDNVRFNVCELNHNRVQSDDWFCADGERRKDGDT